MQTELIELSEEDFAESLKARQVAITVGDIIFVAEPLKADNTPLTYEHFNAVVTQFNKKLA